MVSCVEDEGVVFEQIDQCGELNVQFTDGAAGLRHFYGDEFRQGFGEQCRAFVEDVGSVVSAHSGPRPGFIGFMG